MEVLPQVVFLAGLVGAEDQQVQGQGDGKRPGQARDFGLFRGAGTIGASWQWTYGYSLPQGGGSGNCLRLGD